MEKHKLKHRIWLRVAMLLNFTFLTSSFAICWYGYYASRIAMAYYRWGNVLVVVLFAALFVMFGHTYDAFSVSYNQIPEMVYSQGMAVLFADTIMYIVISLLSLGFVNAVPLLLTLVAQLLFAILWAVLTRRLYFATFPPEKTAVIYEEAQNIESLIQKSGLEKKFEIVKTVTATECLNSGMDALTDIETVFVCGVDSRTRNTILKFCVEQDIRMFVLPRIGDVIMSGAKRLHMFRLPFLQVERYNPPVEYLVFKRMFDIVVAGTATLVLSPIMLLTVIAVKLCDRGPVFYKQCRLTKDGKEFMILKFRSMRVDAERESGARLSSGDGDERVTAVGRFIRKVRIDELPQLFNILKGDMSIVGPRPERPELVAQYMETLPEFNLRLQTKAGLTGYAQVYGKYNTTPYDKLQMDLMYISNPNIIEDLRIIMATIKVLFLPESTEGVAEKLLVARAECALTKENEENKL